MRPAGEAATIRAALQEAVVKCSERCLYQSAKWAGELLNSMIEEPEFDDDAEMTTPVTAAFPGILLSGNIDPEEAALEAREMNKYLLAKSFFDCREFDRCTAVFLPDTILSSVIIASENMHQPPSAQTNDKGRTAIHTPPTPDLAETTRIPKLSQKSLFLALYAKLMAGEKRKDEDIEMVMGPHDSGKTINKELVKINRFLYNWFAERNEANPSSQGWLEYLYGVVLAKERNEKEAMEYLITSVQAFPMNWGAWLEIANLVNSYSELNTLCQRLPRNVYSIMFHLHTCLDLYQSSPALSERVTALLSLFPTSAFLMTCAALLSYHSKDFLSAEHQFSNLLALHPHRLDSLDHYSNILYVMSLRPKLSFLAHLCSSIDKFRPETCVVIGNYYSLLSQHEKAVNYFRRALTLDRTCLSAWTLMGHEYVELKNTHAAIESYRRAVDVNRRDYRAWYGLGQTYEVLEMHAYALWYYKRAAGLRPWDGKMWCAVGSCLQKMGREQEGIKALKRALQADAWIDPADVGSAQGQGKRKGRTSIMDTEVLLQIASMYDKLDQHTEAREWMELCVAQEEGLDASDAEDDYGAEGEREGQGSGVTPATSKARMWLARWAMEHGEWEAALRYAQELCQDGVEVEEAKALVRELRARGAAGGIVLSGELTEGLLASP